MDDINKIEIIYEWKIRIYLLMEKFDEAVKMLKKSRKIAVKTGTLQDTITLIQHYVHLGTCYERLGNTNEAFKTFMKIVEYEKYLMKAESLDLCFQPILEPIVRALFKAGKMKYLLGDNPSMAMSLLKQFCFAYEKCDILREKDSYLKLCGKDHSDLIILESDEERFTHAQEIIRALENQILIDDDRLSKEFKNRLQIIGSNLCKFEKPQIAKEEATEKEKDIEDLRTINKEIEMKSEVMEDKKFIHLFERKGCLLSKLAQDNEAIECFDKVYGAHEADLKLQKKVRQLDTVMDTLSHIQEYYQLLEKHNLLGDWITFFNLYANASSGKYAAFTVLGLNMAGVANYRSGNYEQAGEQLAFSIYKCEEVLGVLSEKEISSEILNKLFDKNKKALPRIKAFNAICSLEIAKKEDDVEEKKFFVDQAKDVLEGVEFNKNLEDKELLNLLALFPYKLSASLPHAEGLIQMHESLRKFYLQRENMDKTHWF